MSFETEKKLTICVTGAAGIGKTQLINSIVNGTFTTQYEPTIQEQYQMKMVQSNQIFNLSIIDTSGSSDYAKLTSGALGNSDCVIICYCPYIPRSFDRVIEAINETRQISEDMPIIIVATKMDLKNDKNTIEKIGKQKIRLIKDLKSELKKKKIFAYFESSVLSGESYKVIFENCIKGTIKSSMWKKKNNN